MLSTKIGGMRHRVVIQKKVTVGPGQNESGEPLSEWQDDKTVWARVEGLRGSEYFQTQQMKASLTTRVTLRYRPSLDVTDRRLKYGSRILDINSSVFDPKRVEIELLCTEQA